MLLLMWLMTRSSEGFTALALFLEFGSLLFLVNVLVLTANTKLQELGLQIKHAIRYSLGYKTEVRTLKRELETERQRVRVLIRILTEVGKAPPPPPPKPEPTPDMKLFGLKRGFTKEQLLMAFRAKAKEYHPDHGGDPNKFRMYIEARRRLEKEAA
jgi:hypothetical protein